MTKKLPAPSNRLAMLLACGLLLAALPAASSGPVAGGATTAPPRLPMPAAPKVMAAGDGGAATLSQIRGLVGEAACEADAQCRVAGIGSRPCGGPESHLAWSTRVTRGSDQQQLLGLITRHAAERQRANEAIGLMSTCEMTPTPAARCERAAGQAVGRCILVRHEAQIR